MTRSYVAAMGLLVALVACSGGDDAGGAGAASVAGPQGGSGGMQVTSTCMPGTLLPCACPDQTTGTATCSASGSSVSACVCGGGPSGSTCVPGSSQACVCTDGMQGAQTCNPAGSFGACVCTGSSGGTGGMNGGTGGASGGTGGSAATECDGIGFTDQASGLCWHTESLSDGMTHRDAQLYCQALVGGLSGWRLPTIDELKAQVRGCAGTDACTVSDPGCLDSSCAPNDSTHPCYGCEELAGPGPAGCYWPNGFGTTCLERTVSGTEVSDGSGTEHWTVAFSTGAVQDDFSAGSVLCVKDAP